MMPMYRYMDSHPQQRNQTFSVPQYPYPAYEPNPPMACAPWPYGAYGGNYGYPSPMPCHSCCNHSNAPGYSSGFRHSYPHTSVPSPMYFVGGYPAPYNEAYPVHHVPPPHYSMELPRYDYDKKMHCCGCPNHQCQQNINKGVRIEEEVSPDVVEKKGNEPFVPAQMKNYPFPVMWIPAQEQKWISGPSDTIEQKKTSSDVKPAESLKSPLEGHQRNGLFPFDISNIGSLMQGGKGEQVQEKCSEDRKTVPIFWIPSFEDQKADGAVKKDNEKMDASQDQKSGEQNKQFTFPFFWLPYENNKQNDEKKKHADSSNHNTTVNEDKSCSKVDQKVTPVKQMDLPKKEDNSEETKRRGREVIVKQVDSTDKASGSSDRSRSQSPKKSSNLPPVCLRVDPFPSKKNGNRSSRSPSPKKSQLDASAETTKASASCTLPEKVQQSLNTYGSVASNGKDMEPSKKEKVIEVVDKGIVENKNSTHESPINSKEASEKTSVGNQCEVKEDQTRAKENVGDTVAQTVEQMAGTAKTVTDGRNVRRKRLSDVEAAVLIQAAYRGFIVRRLEPLKKLKQLAEIQEQAADIRNQITSLETSDLKKDDKQRVVIGETIMRLLLRLDTVQGLLPSLRDIRRSLARELVLLQEKLDDVMTQQSQDTKHEDATVESVEKLDANDNGVCTSEQQEEEALGEKLPACVNENADVSTEPCQGQVIDTMDFLPAVEVELPELSEPKDAEFENQQHDPTATGGLCSTGLDSAPTMVLKDDIPDGQAVLVDTETSDGASEIEECCQATSSVEYKTRGDVLSTASEVLNASPDSSEELLRVALDNGTSPSEPEIEAPSEMSKAEVKQGEVKLAMSQDVWSPLSTDNVTEKVAEVLDLESSTPYTTDEDSGCLHRDSELKKNVEIRMIQENDVSESQAALQQQDGTMEKQVDMGSQVDEVLPGDSELFIEMENQHQDNVIVDNPQPVVSQTFESQPLNSSDEKNTCDMVDDNGASDMANGDDTCSTICDVAERPNDHEDPAEQAKEEISEADTKESRAEDNVILEKDVTLIANEVEGNVVGDESAKKLVEENEKLKEMMQKLMVAGKDQLQVISDLTGRVKDLEKKLAKKKKVRTRRPRANASGAACLC